MSKYIITADWHLNEWAGISNSSERISQRLLDQKNCLQQMLDLAIQEDAVILNAGDSFHAVGAVPTEALNVYNWFVNECKKCGVKYYTASGNHDLHLRRGISAWHNILNLFQTEEERDKEVSLLPHKVRFVDYQEEDFENVKGFDIVVLHKQPGLTNKYGFTMEGCNWKKIAKNNKLVFFGHFHETRKITPTVYIVGQMMQMTQSDCGEDRGCWIVDSENWSVTFHKLEYPELVKIEKVEKEESKFEERIKATSFQDILVEWLEKEGKPSSYLELIQKDITDKLQVVKSVFNGKVTKMYLKDFLSVDEITVEYKNGFWLVLGLNGSGKSSLVGEGIYYGLFDENTKGLAKPEIIRNRPTKQKESIVEIDLVDSQTFYKIRRSSKEGLEVWCEKKNLVDGMTKIQAQQFLEKNILGFDKNTFLAACYFSQEQLLTLANLGDSETTNMVTNLLGFETYDELHELMNQRIKEVTLQLENLEKESVNLNNEIWKNGEQQKNVKEQIEMFTKQQCSLKDEQLKINQQIDEFTTLLVKIVVPSVTTEELDVSLLALNGRKTEMVKAYKELYDNSQNIVQDLRMKQNLDNTKLQNILQEQARIDKEKTKIETVKRLTIENISKHEAIIKSLEENKCSYCGAVIEKDKLEVHIANEKAEIDKLNLSIQDNSAELDKQLNSLYDQEAELREKIESITLEIEKLDAENKSAISLNNAEISKIETEIKEVQKKKDQTLKEQIEANSHKGSLTQQIKQLEQRKLTLVNQLKEVNIDDKFVQVKELEQKFYNLDAQKLDINDKKVRVIEHEAIYTFWANAFSNKGIRPLLLDRFVNEVNEVIKHYCYETSNGEFIVQFTPTTKIRSGIERNKLGLEVFMQNRTVDYLSLSGGEKTRCNLPLCFGLNKWISSRFGIKNGILGILIFDELFAWTDDKFRDNVAELLNNEGKTKSIFVIDHNSTLASYTNNIWQVEKVNDITQLEVV